MAVHPYRSPTDFRSVASRTIPAEAFEIRGGFALLAESPADPNDPLYPIVVTVGGGARTRVTGTPAAGQFRIVTTVSPYGTAWTPQLEFHASDEGLEGTCDYYRAGTILTRRWYEDALLPHLQPITGVADVATLEASYPATTDRTAPGYPGRIAFCDDGSSVYSTGTAWEEFGGPAKRTGLISESVTFGATHGGEYVAGQADGVTESVTLADSQDATFALDQTAGTSEGVTLGDTQDATWAATTSPSFKVAQFTLGSGTGTQDVTWAADSGWADTAQPALVIGLGGPFTANGSAAQGFSQSLGFMSAAAERAAWWGSADNVATTQAKSLLRTAGLSLYTPGATPAANGEFSLSAMLSNGFRISRDVAFGGSYLANALAIGGSSVQVAMGDAATPTSTGAVAYATGFQPTAVILLAVLDDSAAADAASASANVRRAIGFASGTATAAQCTVPTLQRDATAADATNVAARWGRSGRVLSLIDWDGASGSEIVKGVLSAWDANSFTIDWQTVQPAGRRFVWVALGGVSARVGSVLTANPAGNVVVSGVGFAPKAGIFASTRAQDNDTNIIGADALSLALAGPDLTQYAMAQNVGSYTGVTATDYGQIQAASRVYANLGRSSADTFAINRQTGLASWDADGFTLTTYENDGVPVHYLILG